MIQSAVAPTSNLPCDQRRLVRNALQKTAHSELSHVDVKSLDGGVQLSGYVSSFYLKQLAQEIARHTGVAGRVHNKITVLDASPIGAEEAG